MKSNFPISTIRWAAMLAIACQLLLIRGMGQPAAEGVVLLKGKMLLIQSTNKTPLAEAIKFPNDILVETNGTFRIKDGKVRTLADMQELRSDGTLVNPDGSIQPVFDHIVMKNRRILACTDGEFQPLLVAKTFFNGLTIHPDGALTKPAGFRSRMVDGMMFRMDGSVLPSRDTISLKNGKVVVQKDGSLLSIKPGQSIDMTDGSRVKGDGQVILKGGKTIRLQEGQLLIVEGAASSLK